MSRSVPALLFISVFLLLGCTAEQGDNNPVGIAKVGGDDGSGGGNGGGGGTGGGDGTRGNGYTKYGVLCPAWPAYPEEQEYCDFQMLGLACNWSSLEPEEDVYDFGRFQAKIDAVAPGVDIFLLIFARAGWMNGQEILPDSSNYHVSYPPLDSMEFIEFVEDLVDICGPKVKYYQAFNEPDQHLPTQNSGWGGTVDELVFYTNLFADIVHRKNPEAQVLCPAFSSNMDDSSAAWAEALKDCRFDTWAKHLYTKLDTMEYHVNWLWSFNPSKKFCISEMGTPVGTSYGPDPDSAQWERFQYHKARNLILAFDNLSIYPLEFICWSKIRMDGDWTEDHFGRYAFFDLNDEPLPVATSYRYYVRGSGLEDRLRMKDTIPPELQAP